MGGRPAHDGRTLLGAQPHRRSCDGNRGHGKGGLTEDRRGHAGVTHDGFLALVGDPLATRPLYLP